ncbi:hypothetical protein CALCODRAFT_494512 [Calocera cornea HHB12733]|uniref:Uncharacterized protein n=1 Tax=Calocera cornea HHB12733 TaxID=1353952 RepID=A0A165H334_9BASI|nr:hypothetical protein CALCODRAFT_494512 [Calocera cornea HHB12733]
MSTTSLLPSLPPQPANLLAAYWPTAAALLLPLSLLLLLCGPLPLFTHLRTEPGRPPLVSSIVPWLGSYRAMRRDFDGFVESARWVGFLLLLGLVGVGAVARGVVGVAALMLP